MVAVTFITFDGLEQRIEARPGMSLMENATANGVEGIEAVCGGNAYCGTCRVYVDPAWQERLGERNGLETPLLDSIGEDNPAARLSCQLAVTPGFDGLVVRLPASQS